MCAGSMSTIPLPSETKVLHSDISHPLAGANCLRRAILEYGYNPLAAVTRSRTSAWNVPKAHIIEFGLVYEV